MKYKDFPWLKEQIDDIIQFINKPKKHKIRWSLLYFFIGIFLLIICLILIKLRLNWATFVEFQSNEKFAIYTKLIRYYTDFQFLIIYLIIIYSFVWKFMGELIFRFIRLFFAGFFEIFHSSKREFIDQGKEISAKILSIVRRRIDYIFIPFLSLVLIIVCAFLKVWEFSVLEYMHFTGVFILSIIPLYFAFRWFQCFKIQKEQKNYDFIPRFYSFESLRQKLKTTITGFFFFGIFVLFILPSLFVGIDMIVKSGSSLFVSLSKYEHAWKELEAEGIIDAIEDDSYSWNPPRLEELNVKLNPLYEFFNEESIPASLPILQKYFYMVVVLFSLFDIGIPIIIRVFAQLSFKKLIVIVLKNTINSTLIVLIVFFFSRIFFQVNISASLIGILFSTILAFLSALDVATKIVEDTKTKFAE